MNPSLLEKSVEHLPVPELSKSELKATCSKLWGLQEAVGAVETQQPSPRQTRALVVAAVVSLLSAVGPCHVLSHGVAGAAVQILGPVLLACIAYGVVLRRSKAPSTWVEVLDKRLAEYSPLRRADLLGLQRDLREAGFLDVTVVRPWLDRESDRYQEAHKRLNGPPARQFLQMQL